MIIQGRETARSLIAPLPCGHYGVILPRGSYPVTRRCKRCRKYYLVEPLAGATARVTDTTCAVCGGDLEGESDIWHCRSCGSEFDNPIEDA